MSSISEPVLQEAPKEAPLSGSGRSPSHKRLTLLLVLLAVLLLAAGAFLMVRLLRHPLKKAAYAGRETFRDLERSDLGIFLQNMEKHGSLYLKADIFEMQDLLAELLPMKLKLDAEAELSFYRKEGSLALQAAASLKEKRLLDGLLVYQEGRDLAVSSEALLGKTSYGFNLKNLGKNLEGSALDPAGGGRYALEANLFQRLKNLSSSGQSYRELVKEAKSRGKELLYRGIDYLIQNAQFTGGRQSLSLAGETLSVQTVSMTMDEKVLRGLLDELIDYVRSDARIRDFLLKLLDKLGFLSPQTTPEELLERIMNRLDEWKQALPQWEESIRGTQVNTLFYLYRGRLLRLDLRLGAGETESYFHIAIGPDPSRPGQISLEYRLPGGPQLRASYEVSVRDSQRFSARCTIRQQAADQQLLQINWDKESGDLSLLFEDKERSSSAALTALLLKENDRLTLDPKKLSLTRGDTVREISLAGLHLEANEKAELPELPHYTEITSMSEEQISAVLDDIQKVFQDLLRSLPSFFGF